MTTQTIISPVLESFNHDGIEIARRRNVRRRSLPLRQAVLFLLAVVSFKIFLMLHLGQATYGHKMATLAEGSAVERVAARAMVLDPLSHWVALELQRLSQ